MSMRVRGREQALLNNSHGIAHVFFPPSVLIYEKLGFHKTALETHASYHLFPTIQHLISLQYISQHDPNNWLVHTEPLSRIINC